MKVTKKQTSYPRIITGKHDLFTFVEIEKGKFIIAVGNSKVSNKEFSKLEDAKKYVNSKPWELICAVGSLVAQHTFEQLKIKEFEQFKEKENEETK